MTKKKAQPVKLPLSSLYPEAEEDLDIQVLASELAVDYPLLDPPLIIALLSDFHPSELFAQLPAIRDQLGILEAAFVPDSSTDTDHSQSHSAPASSSTGEDNDAEVDDDKTPGLGLGLGFEGLKLEDRGVLRVPHGTGVKGKGKEGSRSGSSVRKERGREMTRSSSASGSGSTSPSSVVDEEDGSFGDEIELLKSLFPAVTPKQLRAALSSEPSLPAAIDHLLSLELIRDVESAGFWPGEESDTQESASDLEGPNRTKLFAHSPLAPTLSRTNSAASRKSRKKTVTVPLVDTLQRQTSRPERATSPMRLQTGRAQSPARRAIVNSGISAGSSPNAWHTIASLAVYLTELLPDRTSAYFNSYLHAPAYHSAYTAVRASLDGLPSKVVGEREDRANHILQEMYGVSLTNGGGTRQTQLDLELCSKVGGGDVGVVMDLMDLLAEISLWPGDDDLERYDQFSTRSTPSSPLVPSAALPLPVQPRNPDRLSKPKLPSEPLEKYIPGSKPALTSHTNPTAYDDFGLPSSIPSSPKVKSSKPQIHPFNWRSVDNTRIRSARAVHHHAESIPAYARGVLPHDQTPGALDRAYRNQPNGVAECYNKAAIERSRREDAVRLAGRHFKRGGNKAVNGAVAGAYALQAREAADRAREWELKAARIVITTQMDTGVGIGNGNGAAGNTIDLHHLTIHEGVTLALEAAERWYEREKAREGFAGFAGNSNARGVGFVPNKALTVVTGVGRHSAGKKGVLGPAVGTALEGAGWRVERGEGSRGYLVVRGRR